MEETQDFCVNCTIYGWAQLSDRSKLLRCSTCKFISYCSKECQQEHWVKVHRHHCKYMSGQKKLPLTRHDTATCSGCLQQTMIGLEGMSQVDNPCLGCSWVLNVSPHVVKISADSIHSCFTFPDPGAVHSVPLPFKLGEMSGIFLTKAEHTASILNRLLHKLKLIKRPALIIDLVASNNMEKLVNMMMRQFIWNNYINSIPNSLESTTSHSIKSVVGVMYEVSSSISETLLTARFRDQTVFRPWDTFKLFLNILLLQFKNLAFKDATRIGLPDISQDLLKLIVTPAQFNDKWEKVLHCMDGNLVPFTDLLKIMCGGHLDQECFNCSKEVIVLDVGYENCKGPFIYHGVISAILCGEMTCYEQVDAIDTQALKIFGKLSHSACGNMCDYCFLATSGTVHRCSKCMTKYYCGVECRDQDWVKVHKMVCKEGQDRKIKCGKQERKERGIESAEDFVERLEQLRIDENY